MDLVRSLLLEMEGGKTFFCLLTKEQAENCGAEANEDLSQSQVNIREHHLWLIRGAGLATFEGVTEGWYLRHITWSGHDFIDSIRDDQIWRATKEGAKRAGGFTFEIMTAIAKGLITENIRKISGVEIDL